MTIERLDNVEEDEFILSLLHVVRETDPNYETFHWMQVMRCRVLYKEPRVLPKKFK